MTGWNWLIRKGRNFAAKVHAFNAGKERLKVAYKVIGNLDANVSLDDFIEQGYNSAIVSGQRQMFRRRCFEEIGGYFPSKNGGIDWIAVTTARMIGWKTRSYREKSFFHHRVLGTADRGILGSSYAYGKKDYYPGGHALWGLFRCSYRMIRKPYLWDVRHSSWGISGHF